MQPGIFVEMLTLEMGICRGLSSGSAGLLLLPGGLGEGFPEKRLALRRASVSSGQLSHRGRSIIGHGTEEFQAGLGAGWVAGELGDSGVIRQWKGGLGPEVPAEKPWLASEQGGRMMGFDLWYPENSGVGEGTGHRYPS